ncbi:MAG: thymidine phosphorylase [Saprospiraceae bacterium]|nr:thymidine phosphorylase [Saprospiraceae bacterium]
MSIIDLIRVKRDGRVWDKHSISELIRYVCDPETPDYQIAAILMAIYLRGMNDREITDLTSEMAASGKKINLSNLKTPVLDKHSTGGVGDKTSLVLMPMVAACGVKTAKLSGRGLGHTGGTLDKLSVFPGFRSDLEHSEILDAVEKSGLVISGQTEGLVPADKRMYALRDLTATVDSIPLIVSSIMSKKIATGASALLLDVKVGTGSIFADRERSKLLAKKLVQVGKSLKLNTRAVLTDMSAPLGYAVGNALEVKEAIYTMQGRGPTQLRELCLELGSRMVVMSGLISDLEVAREQLAKSLESGRALEYFKRMIENQGGDPYLADHPEEVPVSSLQSEVHAKKEGFISCIDARSIGIASMLSGAGRITKDQRIDLGAGILLHKKVGDRVNINELILTIYSSKQIALDQAKKVAGEAVTISSTKPDVAPLIIDEVT